MRQQNNILRELRRDPSVIDRFWASVNRNETADGCWEWLPCAKGDTHPTFRSGRYSVTAARVAWFTRTGELPMGGRVLRLCENPVCVRPSHLAWAVGRRTERDLTAMSDGYERLAGCPYEPPHRAPTVARMCRVLQSNEEEAA